MNSQLKSDIGWGPERSQAQGLQSLLVLWGCSASPTQKLCDPHTFGIFTEAFQKSPRWLRCGWKGLVMNNKRYSFGFRSSLSGTGTNTQHKFLITGPSITRCFLATCVFPTYTGARPLNCPSFSVCFQTYSFCKMRDTRRMHLKSCEDVSVTMILDSTRLGGGELCLTWLALFLIWFHII